MSQADEAARAYRRWRGELDCFDEDLKVKSIFFAGFDEGAKRRRKHIEPGHRARRYENVLYLTTATRQRLVHIAALLGCGIPEAVEKMSVFFRRSKTKSELKGMLG